MYDRQIDNVFERFASKKLECRSLIADSFLPDDEKEKYQNIFQERLERLGL